MTLTDFFARLASIASSAMTGVFVEGAGATDSAVDFSEVLAAILADFLGLPRLLTVRPKP